MKKIVALLFLSQLLVIPLVPFSQWSLTGNGCTIPGTKEQLSKDNMYMRKLM